MTRYTSYDEDEEVRKRISCGSKEVTHGMTIPYSVLLSLFMTVPRRYFCCGSLLLLVIAVRIYTLVHLLCELYILVKFG